MPVHRLDPKTLQCLKARDPATLERAFREITPTLLRILAANAIRNETAEDLVHQTWERFFTNLDKFEGRSSLGTFVCGILLNQIRQQRRSAARAPVAVDTTDSLSDVFSSEGWWTAPPAEPWEHLASKQVAEFIDDCLSGLNDTQRSALVLKEVEGEDAENICNVLQVSASNLRVLIFRAKEKLRQCLERKIGRTERR